MQHNPLSATYFLAKLRQTQGSARDVCVSFGKCSDDIFPMRRAARGCDLRRCREAKLQNLSEGIHYHLNRTTRVLRYYDSLFCF